MSKAIELDKRWHELSAILPSAVARKVGDQMATEMLRLAAEVEGCQRVMRDMKRIADTAEAELLELRADYEATAARERMLAEKLEALAKQEPVAYRYTASGYGKWHYQEHFPDCKSRDVEEIGALEKLYAAPIPAPVADEREAFEAYLFRTVDNIIGTDVLARNSDGNYAEEWVQMDWETYQLGRADERAALAQHGDVDPLQGAVDWLVKAVAPCRCTDIQRRLNIGYNRAKHLLDAALAGKGEA